LLLGLLGLLLEVGLLLARGLLGLGRELVGLLGQAVGLGVERRAVSSTAPRRVAVAAAAGGPGVPARWRVVRRRLAIVALTWRRGAVRVLRGEAAVDPCVV